MSKFAKGQYEYKVDVYDSDHIYYNINITNPSTSQLLLAEFNQTAAQAILANPSEYNLSVVRFTIPAQQIPIFIFVKGLYTVTLSINGLDYMSIVPYIPGFTAVLDPGDTQVYSYNQFLLMINQALANSFLASNGSFTTPLLIYSTSTNYKIGDVVVYLDLVSGALNNYRSIQDNNVNKLPNVNPLFWSAYPNPQFPAYNIGQTYLAGQTVTYLLNRYISLLPSIGILPTSGAPYWSLLPNNSSFELWSAVRTYNLGEIVVEGLVTYFSIKNNNLNHMPSTSPTFWNAYPLQAPYLTFNPVTDLISVNAPVQYFSNGITFRDQPFKLWFDTALWQFFGNFLKLYNGNSPTTANSNGKNYNVIITPLGNNNIVIPPEFGGGNGYAMSQEFTSLYNWNSFRTLLFLTHTIPTKKEYTPTFRTGIPIPRGIAQWNSLTSYSNGDRVYYSTLNGVQDQSSNTPWVSLQDVNLNNIPRIGSPFWAQTNDVGVNGTTNFQSILTDYQPTITTGYDVRSYYQYAPQSEYRLVSLNGTDPLKTLDLQIYWQDKIGNIFPLYLNPQESASIKLLFRKKSFNGPFLKS